MSEKRPRRIDRATAEQLLDGHPAGRRGAPEELVVLLHDAVRPAAAQELAGEPAVLAAFRAAQATPFHLPRRRHMIKTALAKLLTLKAAAVVTATAAAGGVALAASTGNLPASLGGDQAKPSHASQSEQPRGKGSPSPSLVGLCHAYRAGAGDNPGKALENPAFRALIDAAGDRDKVTAYCTTLLAKQGKATAKPSHPTGKPSVAASAASRAPEHPTARPSEHPTGPSTHPSR